MDSDYVWFKGWLVATFHSRIYDAYGPIELRELLESQLQRRGFAPLLCNLAFCLNELIEEAALDIFESTLLADHV